jgi:hypothetical protein
LFVVHAIGKTPEGVRLFPRVGQEPMSKSFAPSARG